MNKKARQTITCICLWAIAIIFICLAVSQRKSSYPPWVLISQRSSPQKGSVKKFSTSLKDVGKLATFAEKVSGVRREFILGILGAEANFGKNVGNGHWANEYAHMECEKQREAFLYITERLGMDPDTTPVSRKAWYGKCGGAMGFAQFMPMTWLSYEDKISRITGNYPPSPWNLKDAIIAASLLLRDNGAHTRTPEAERKAALMYLAGMNWADPQFSFYGEKVMKIAQTISAGSGE